MTRQQLDEVIKDKAAGTERGYEQWNECKESDQYLHSEWRRKITL